MVRACLFSYFEVEDLPRLMEAIRASGMPAGTRVHVGSYGVNAETSARVIAHPGGRYSPMFKAHIRTEAWARRRLTPAEERRVGRRFSGRVPDESSLLRLSTAQRIGWGIEVGRRYRDAIRHARQAGIRVSLWQLDELGTQIAGVQGRQHREFVRGILQGLNLGRRVLGDRASRGSVWATRRALRLASLPVDPELSAFWLQLERSAFRIVGEEYPDFVGHRARASGGPARRALAGRYLAGMSPAYRLGRGLGGNVSGLSRAGVNRWRSAYVAERARLGAAGFAEFHFVSENSRAVVMQDVARAVARGMALG